jgi:hypothetical protein
MDKIEFVAPYSIEECRHRLESRHQKFNLLKVFILPWQVHIVIQVKPIDKSSYRFEIKKLRYVGSNYAYTILNGTLRIQSPTSTLVNTKADYGGIYMMMGCLGLVVLLTWSGMVVGAISSEYRWLGTLIGWLLAGGSMLWVHKKAMYDKQDLFRLVQEILRTQPTTKDEDN